MAVDIQETLKSRGTKYSTVKSIDDVLPTLKIMILGDGSVGKSSLILQYMYKEVNNYLRKI
jgi:GTPase SAR1 family protein